MASSDHSVVPAWKNIRLTDADGGLRSCFDATCVHEGIRQKLMEQEGIATLRDFATSYRPDDHVSLLDAIWRSTEGAKDHRRERGRLLSAYDAARRAITNLEEAAPSSSASDPRDWEDPLPEGAMEQLLKD